MSDVKLLWGDIHNHNELGYGQGSIERSYSIARSSLDFYAFTPHAQRVDGGHPEGYDSVNRNWREIQQFAKEWNRAGEFTTFLAYEWHSVAWGDFCVFYPDDDQEIGFAGNPSELVRHVVDHGGLMIPHHIGYLNGIDWEQLSENATPVVDIYSEHGCSEKDSGPFPLSGHSIGPGGSQFTAQYGLKKGHKFGMVASTDNHDGFPGAHGLGLVGVWARENSREAIFSALRERRTIAVTGDRIMIDFHAGTVPMGSTARLKDVPALDFRVVGWDLLKQIEILRNNVPVAVFTPQYLSPSKPTDAYRLRLEWGGGPMKGYQIFEWKGRVTVSGGSITHSVPYFKSDPFDEHRRKHVHAEGGDACEWESFTSRGGIFTTRNSTFTCSPTEALALEITGNVNAEVTIEVQCLAAQSIVSTSSDWVLCNALEKQTIRCTLGELLEGSLAMNFEVNRTFLKVHRAVPSALFSREARYELKDAGRSPAYYYLRVTQENGQLGWSSPIWLE